MPGAEIRPCPICGKKISSSSMEKHQLTQPCRNATLTSKVAVQKSSRPVEQQQRPRGCSSASRINKGSSHDSTTSDVDDASSDASADISEASHGVASASQRVRKAGKQQCPVCRRKYVNLADHKICRPETRTYLADKGKHSAGSSTSSKMTTGSYHSDIPKSSRPFEDSYGSASRWKSGPTASRWESESTASSGYCSVADAPYSDQVSESTDEQSVRDAAHSSHKPPSSRSAGRPSSLPLTAQNNTSAPHLQRPGRVASPRDSVRGKLNKTPSEQSTWTAVDSSPSRSGWSRGDVPATVNGKVSSPNYAADLPEEYRTYYSPSPSPTQLEPQARGGSPLFFARTPSFSEDCSGSEHGEEDDPYFPTQFRQGRRHLEPSFDTKRLEREAEKLQAKLNMDLANTQDTFVVAKTFFEDEVKTTQDEKNTAVCAFNPFRDRILKKFSERTPWDWKYLSSGSHYDGTKVSRVDEIDCMFLPDFTELGRLTLEAGTKTLPPTFGMVKFHITASDKEQRAKAQTFMEMFCGPDGRVSSRKFREKSFQIFSEAVSDQRRATKVEMPEGSPSFAVEFNAIPSSLENSPGLRPISLDLVPALHVNEAPPGAYDNIQVKALRWFRREVHSAGCDVIPKQYKGTLKGLKADDVDYMWRLSFSRAEKMLTKHVDSLLEKAMDRLGSATSPGGRIQRACSTPGPGTPRGMQRANSTPSSPHRAQSPTRYRRPVTCRKLVLRYLKRLLELIKGLDNSRATIHPNSLAARLGSADQLKNPVAASLKRASEELKKSRNLEIKEFKFTTYQVRTLLWLKFYSLTPGEEKWTRDRLKHRLKDMLIQLRKMVAGQMHVPHFFIPHSDIMEDVLVEERKFLYIMFLIAENVLCGG